MTDYKFEGWLGRTPEAINGKMEWAEYEPKKWTEDDVDIQVTHCGICGSDLHTLRSGWGATPYPCCVGHEIVGKAVRVGKNISHIKVGDRVGVGAQGRSCMKSDCPECGIGKWNYCSRGAVNTYGSVYPDGEGKSYGGYADYNRTNGHFQNGCGPGKNVGIVGVGGLGHFGVLFAKALGADKVVGISRRASKKDEVLQLGADAYIATADDKDWAKTNKRTLDLIICTVSSGDMPLQDYLKLLRVGGTFIQVGGSLIGSPQEIQEMLDFAAEKQVKPWVELRPLKEANQAVIDMEAGKARYRYVLVNEKHASKSNL
ncbi:unnamed protein product [Parascedosporium putredinis]|uniref:Uncharacterized protein n=1 Tax=Parascedosporium putredinis TaxID=1442378 RepID=A0A9P1ME72_9PEZI|nr:unnamed protein product [Parascedosporium putredinis]CAI8004073.1 unnamed protein product [Parascedosporium putredinis]